MITNKQALALKVGQIVEVTTNNCVEMDNPSYAIDKSGAYYKKGTRFIIARVPNQEERYDEEGYSLPVLLLDGDNILPCSGYLNCYWLTDNYFKHLRVADIKTSS